MYFKNQKFLVAGMSKSGTAAAEFLRDTVRESTNIEYPIITDSEGKTGFEIAVGKTRRFDYDVSYEKYKYRG